MRERLAQLNMRMNAFMRGRYGMDDLGQLTLGIAILLIILSFFNVPWTSVAAIVVLLIGIFRCYSKSYEKRRAENDTYLRISKKPRGWLKIQANKIKNRNTLRYCKCPTCKKTFSVPKGKGKIRATCPYCHEQSIHTT